MLRARAECGLLHVGFRGSCPEFSAFVRAILGLAYVPLSRLAESIRNRYILGKRLNDRQAGFALAFLKYLG